MAQTDREVLFANEAFVVGMLQAVSGGAVVAALAQAESLVKWAGRIPHLVLMPPVGCKDGESQTQSCGRDEE